MRVSRQEYWSGLPFPTPGGLSNPGTEPASPALAGGFSTTAPPGKPFILIRRGRDSKALSLPCEDMVRRWPFAAGKGILTRTHQPGTQTSDSQPLELREINLSWFSPKVYGTLLRQPTWMNPASHSQQRSPGGSWTVHLCIQAHSAHTPLMLPTLLTRR